MNIRVWIAVGLVLTMAVGCQKNETSTPATSSGQRDRYLYTGYDLNNNEIVSGTLILNRQDSTITGERNLTGNAPEAGSGNIEGRILPTGEIMLSLTPHMVGELYLKGGFTNSDMNGDRLFNTGSPPFDRKVGSFRAAPMLGN